MKLYITCHCNKSIRLKGNYNTADDLRRQHGDFIQLHCPHCGNTVHLPYTWAWSRSWGPWGTIALLSAFIMGSVGVMMILQHAGASIGAVVWIPIVALAFYGRMAKIESDAVEQFERSKFNAPSPHLTPAVAATWSDTDLLCWYDIGEPENITNLYERVIYYATILHHEEPPRYMEWFYYYEGNYNPIGDDGIDLYSSLMAVGATRHAAIVLEAREIYLQHKDEVERCVKSVAQDGYQLLLALNLFGKQDDALAQVYHAEPLVPLVADYIRRHVVQLEGSEPVDAEA